MAFEKRPNTGCLFTNYYKKHEKASDFKGTLDVEPELLLELARNRTDEYVTIKIDGWKGADKNGKPFVSLKIDTWKPQERQDAPDKSQRDPWEL